MASFSRKRKQKQNSFDDDGDDSSSSSDDFGNDNDDENDLRLETKASATTTIGSASVSAMTTSPMTGMGGAATINNGHGNVLVRRATIRTSLSKKLLEVFRPNNDLMNSANANERPDLKKKSPAFKVSDETADALSEVIRVFVVEAHNRAMIEAECDAEGEELDSDDDDDNDDDEMSASAANKNDDSDGNNITTRTKKKKNGNIKPVVPIHAKHITKIAAELLMDFS